MAAALFKAASASALLNAFLSAMQIAIGLMIMRMGYASGRGALKQLFAGAPGNTTAGQPAE
jgi:hypothetical protein